MISQVDIGNIPLVREHVRQVRIDMLASMFTVKFGACAKQVDLSSRLAGMDDKQLQAVAIRLVTLDDLDEVLDGNSPAEEPHPASRR